MITYPTARFHEVQRFRQLWFVILIGLVAAIGWVALFVQIVLDIPFGNNPGPDWVIWLLWATIGVALPIFMLALPLHTIVTHDRLIVSFVPIHRRTIPLAEIKSAEAEEYSPVGEFGGWGIRWSPGSGMCYNVSGKLGVRIELKNGKKLLIGTQKPEQLANALKF